MPLEISAKGNIPSGAEFLVYRLLISIYNLFFNTLPKKDTPLSLRNFLD